MYDAVRWYARRVPDVEETRVFYDQFFDHLLYDRLRLNPRHAVATRLMRRHIPRGASVLDLGCGIGITSEIAAKKAGEVVGVDLSPRLIEYATTTVPTATFYAGDITTIDLGRRFDAVCLFDVYEHMPLDRRADLWRNVDKHLGDGGRVLMTVPHPGATEQSAADDPESLQIVDEVVNPDELLTDARAVGLLPHAFSTYGVDRDPEYFWLVLERLHAPTSRPRSRWKDPIGQLRVRAGARRYWRAARDLRGG